MSAANQSNDALNYFPTFAGLKAFYAVASDGSVASAAKRLGISASAVSHQLRNLEAELGLRLFAHKKGRLELTPEGVSYFDAIKGAMARISEATMEIRSAPGRRRVSLTLTPSFAAGWLMPRLRELTARHPDVELNLVTTTRLVDLSRENVDLAIRRGREPFFGYNHKPLLAERIVPVLAPQMKDLLVGLSFRQVLERMRILVNTTLLNEWDEWCTTHDIPVPAVSRRFNLDTYELTIQAARDGLGVALGRRPIVDPLLREGHLVLASDEMDTDSVQYYVVWRKDDELSSSAKQIRDWLLSQRAEKSS